MSLQSHVAYYNENEINSLYTQHVSETIPIEDTERKTVTAKVVGALGALLGSVSGTETNEKVEEIVDQDTKKAVELTKEFIESIGIPELGITSSESSYYKYSGEVEAFSVQGGDYIKLIGESNGQEFISYTSADKWTSGSYTVRAESGDPQVMNINGIAYPTSDTEDGREVWKFIVIYQGEGRFLK